MVAHLLSPRARLGALQARSRSSGLFHHSRTSRASASMLAATFASTRRSVAAAQALSSFVIGHLSDASLRKQAGAFGLAPGGISAPVGAHQKGEQLLGIHAFTFALSRLVTQPVTSLNFFKGPALQDEQLQREFPLLARMEGPAIVPAELMRTATSYRQAVRLCWALRRLRNLTFRQLAAECDLVHQHVGDYFNADDKPGRRDLPAEAVRRVEALLGNTAISQWHARGAAFTVLEELQASRRAA